MSIYVTLNGGYVGLQPGTSAVYHDRKRGGLWEELSVTQRGPEGWCDLDFVDGKKPLRLNQQTRQLETGTHHDGWGGQWVISADGKTATCDTVTLNLEGYTVTKAIHLEQRGQDFIDGKGNRIVYPAVDAFCAFRQYRDGGPDALKPFLEESNRLGFTAWRMWSQGSKKQNGVMDLSPREAGYYDAVRPCTDLLNAHGIVPIWTAFVDNQDVRSGINHWVGLGAILQGSAALMSGFNQWSKNKSDFDPWALPSPGGGLIWSRGSDVDDTITDPRGAPASELHATRNSFDRALMDATASPPFMRSKGAGMVWMTEGNPFGDGNGYSEQQAWQLGRGYSILWSLAVFHNRQSQRGLLMNDDTARCAAAFVKGMTL